MESLYQRNKNEYRKLCCGCGKDIYQLLGGTMQSQTVSYSRTSQSHSGYVDDVTGISYIINNEKGGSNTLIPVREDRNGFKNRVFDHIQRNGKLTQGTKIVGPHNFNHEMGCGICNLIRTIANGTCKYQGWKQYSEWTTANENVGHKTSGDDKYFQIVPNEHIETLKDTHGKPHSYQTILDLARKDDNFRHDMLMHIACLAEDAVRFANTIIQQYNIGRTGRMANYIVPSTGQFYSPTDGSEKEDPSRNLYMVVHFASNSIPHMHVHCYVSGNYYTDNKKFFIESQTNKTSTFGPRENLFNDGGTNWAMTLEELYKQIAMTDPSAQWVFTQFGIRFMAPRP